MTLRLKLVEAHWAVIRPPTEVVQIRTKIILSITMTVGIMFELSSESFKSMVPGTFSRSTEHGPRLRPRTIVIRTRAREKIVT